MNGRIEITIKEEQEWHPWGGEAGYLSTPQFVIRANGIRVGYVSNESPEVAKIIMEALNKPTA